MKIGRQKFSKSMRLARHEDFEAVYRRGRRHSSSHMTAFFLPQPQPVQTRLGLTVGRALGGAVTRNRIKRKMREALRLSAPWPAGFDIVINPRKSALEVEFRALRAEVARMLAAIAKSAGSSQLADRQNLGAGS